MKALVQRVDRASVAVADEVTGCISRGLVALVGVAKGDSAKDIQYMAEKIVNLRIFSDDKGKFNLSLLDINGGLLLISQFTLLADTHKGRRPSFIEAAPPAEAESLFNALIKACISSGLKVEAGRFQQHMIVEIVNNGPVTIMLDSRDKAG
ncbi:MAG TPA: D-aminoacyl-tRNA deacylase [Dehalococcoidia bacterium]|nr:D-aminoacyl-tRNA deacylase [Dehalococcoidia bacterium]